VTRSSQGRVATVKAIAAKAGVSSSTVSKALNGSGQLRRETRRSIAAVARQLGRPATTDDGDGGEDARTYTVGVIATDDLGPVTSSIVLGAMEALASDRTLVVLSIARYDRIREQHFARALSDRHVDGILVAGHLAPPRPTIGSNLPVPVVYAGTRSESPHDLSILIDERQGAGLAIQHLVDIGCTRIAHITGPGTDSAAQTRAAAAEASLGSAGLRLVAELPMFGDWTERWGREAATSLIRSAEMFDGVFCGNDQVARGAVEALHEAGRSVPSEVSVIGMGNYAGIGDGCRPTLTTVDLSLPDLGAAAAKRLLGRIEGHPAESGVRFLPCRLVTRESTEVRVTPPIRGRQPQVV
jgi:LacI family transcriptional regulator